MDQNQEKSTLKREIRLEVGQRLREFYTVRGLKRKSFSDSIGWLYDTVRSYEEGRSEPGGDFFKKLMEVYPDADIQYIMTGFHSSDLQMIPVREIPLVQDVKAGSPILGFSDEEIIGKVYTTNMKDKDLFALRVRGNSMEPEISEGDTVTCAPHRAFVSGKIYVIVTADSEATLKQVWRKEGGYGLVARNPDYPLLFLKDEEIERLYRVVEISKSCD